MKFPVVVFFFRLNAKRFDLNRNFPGFFQKMTDEIQKETLAIIDWVQSTQFVLSASLHGGALVVNYPFDNYRGGGAVVLISVLSQK